MGCCKSKARQVSQGSHGLYAQHPHIMFMGLSGVGKTTLLYRTLLPGWREENLTMEPTPAFHHELCIRGGMTLSLWDLSGNDALQRSWVTLYRFVKMWAAVYVVNLMESDPERIDRSRTDIRKLLAEDCLSDSAIVIVMNRFGVAVEGLPVSPEEMASRLGLTDAAEQGEAGAGEDQAAAAAAAAAEAAAAAVVGGAAQVQRAGVISDRVRWYVVDAKDAASDPQWAAAMQFMLSHFLKMLGRQAVSARMRGPEPSTGRRRPPASNAKK